MKKKIQFTLLVTLLINASCNNESSCTKIKLGSEEKKWFDFYEKNSTIYFVSNLNDIDTFNVNVPIRASYTPCNKFELSEYQYEEIAVLLKPIKCHGLQSDYCDIILKFSKHLQKESKKDCLKSFKVFDLRTDLLNSLSEFQDNVQIKAINKRLNCYTFNFSKPHTSDMNGGIHVIKEFSWSKEFGLVRYELFDGQIYELTRWK